MATRQSKNETPPMVPRPIYVEYVAVRTCRYNPSWGRRPERKESLLWDRWRARHRNDTPSSRIDTRVSEPPPKRPKRT